MLRAIQGAIRFGLTEDTPPEEANHIRLTNVFLLLFLAGSLVETSVLFVTGAYSAAMINSTAPLVFGGGLLLMRVGQTRLARLMVLTIAYLAAYLIAAVLGREANFQFIILFSSAMAFSFFSTKEWKYVLYGLFLPIASFLLLEATNYRPVGGFERLNLSEGELRIIRMTTVSTAWLLMVMQFGYFIRSRKMAQEQLISSAKMVSLGQMAAGIAHEINNPLASIVGDSQLLAQIARNGVPPGKDLGQIASRIQRTSNRIGMVVRGLRALSRDASGDPFVRIPLGRVVQLTLDCCKVRVQGQGIALHVKEIPEDWMIMGREAQISEVLLNLINNSVDAIEQVDERWIEINAHLREGHAEIAVIDSGKGIRPEIRRKIFDPFFTTKPVGKGTGLGLSVSQGILNAHHGRIFYDEESPRTRFVIRLPVA